MEFRELLELLGATVAVGAVAVLFYLYYTKEAVRDALNKFLPFLPLIFAFLSNRTEDKVGQFDTHDAFVVLGRLSQHIRETVNDPENTSFDDVQDDLYEFISAELERYNASGVKGVPDLNDATIQMQIKVAFETIKRLMSDENSAGTDS